MMWLRNTGIVRLLAAALFSVIAASGDDVLQAAEVRAAGGAVQVVHI
jgi:hypothetical protein